MRRLSIVRNTLWSIGESGGLKETIGTWTLMVSRLSGWKITRLFFLGTIITEIILKTSSISVLRCNKILEKRNRSRGLFFMILRRIFPRLYLSRVHRGIMKLMRGMLSLTIFGPRIL